VAAYENSTGYTAGNIVTSGGYYIQALTSGTSAGTGNPTLKNYTQTISDANTLTWGLVSKTSTVAWNFSGNSSEFYSKFIDASGAMNSGLYVSSAASFKCYACLASQTINAPVGIVGGTLVEFTDLTTGYPLVQQQAGVVTTNSFTGFLSVNGGQILGDYGLNIAGGRLSLLGANVLATNYYGVILQSGIIDYTIVGNTFTAAGCVSFLGSNNYGVVTNNTCNGAAFNGSPGTNSSFYGNDGSAVPVKSGGTGVATITGAIKGNGTSAFTQAACADLSNGATGCSTATGTSGGTTPLLNGVNTWSGNQTFSAQIIPAYGTPTITSGACGTTTNGTIAAGGTNQSGEVIIGSAATTSCTINFSTTIVAPLACLLEPGNAQAATELANSYVSAITTGHFVITGTALASTDYYFHCF
jgi:hypothetical protein